MMASGNCKTSRIFENQLLFVSNTAEYDLNQSFKNFGLLPAHSYPDCHNTFCKCDEVWVPFIITVLF